MRGKPIEPATDRANGWDGRRMALRRLAALAAAAALVTSGCAWERRYRTVRPRETLELESFTVEVPDDATWKVSRYRDAQGRSLELAHSRNGVLDATLRIVALTGGGAPAPREEMLARLQRELPQLLTGDATPRFAEVPAAADPRFGPSAVQAVARVEESDASAGLLVKRVVSGAVIEFVPPSAPGRLVVIAYLEEPRRGATAAEL